MKVLKFFGFLLLAYVGLVVAFETFLGISQPESERTIVITTTDPDGSAHDRVVSRLESEGKMYVAVNHWPRAWYYRLLENPKIMVTSDDLTAPYLAVAVDGAEHDQVQADNPTGLGFRILTGFPPRYFVRLDPT